MKTTRRNFLTIGAASSLLLANPAMLLASGATEEPKWKVGITDWDLRGVMGRTTSFALAKELGIEGVQVSYQSEAPNRPDSLAIRANRPRFLAAAREAGVAITSFCIGQLNSYPLATTPEAENWVEDCLEAMDEMDIEVVLIPFFGNADMNLHKEHQPLVIEKFRRLAPIAERKKKILAIESRLTAEDHLKMINRIDSDAVRVYYDTGNSHLMRYDIFHEMELLGRRMIPEIHIKDGPRLGTGEIDFTRVWETLQIINYEGWLVLEGSVTGDWRESQIANAQLLKRLIGR